MQIHVRDIPADGITVALDEDADQLDPNIIGGGITGNITLSRSGDSVLISGILHASLRLLCGRCLECFPRSLEISVHMDFEKEVVGGVANGGEVENNDLDISFYKGETINLRDFIREELLLNLPMAYLCTDGCLGLCPRCGTNRNNSRCGCILDEGDPKWAPLQKFMKH
jgi:uncharacterized protein